MRYDINAEESSFCDKSELLDFDVAKPRIFKQYKGGAILSKIFTVYLVVHLIVPRVIKKMFDITQGERTLLTFSTALLFAAAILLTIPPINVTEKEAKAGRFIGKLCGVVGIIVSVLTALLIFNVVDFTIDQELGLKIMTYVLIFLTAACFFGGLISFIVAKSKYSQKTEAEVIGYDELWINGRKGKEILSAPVYMFNVDGVKYIVYEGKYLEASKRPAIKQKANISYNEADPYDCIIGKNTIGIQPMIISIPLLVIVIGLLLPSFAGSNTGSSSVQKDPTELTVEDYYKKINKFMLDDAFLEDVLELDGEDHDFKIYVRVLENTEGEDLVFEPVEGLSDRTKSNYSDATEGDEFYWIQRDDGMTMALKKSAYAYNGSHLEG